MATRSSSTEACISTNDVGTTLAVHLLEESTKFHVIADDDLYEWDAASA
jgi:hypothetical protein